MVKAIVMPKIANLFNDHEIKIRQNMSFFVKVYHNFTSVLCTHDWLVVLKSDFKLVSRGSYILDNIFITGDQVNNVFRFTMKVLPDKVFSACASTRKMIRFYLKILTEIALPLTFKATSYFCVIGAVRSCQNFFYVFSSSKWRNNRSFREDFGQRRWIVNEMPMGMQNFPDARQRGIVI